MQNRCLLYDLGHQEYRKTLLLQERVLSLRLNKKVNDILFLVEHNPVVTIGQRPGANCNLKIEPSELLSYGIDLVEVKRGGDITYHGPGQLVGYPIIDLMNHTSEGDVYLFIRALERSLINALSQLGFRAFCKEGYTGVWLEQGKVAAVGLQVKKGVTMHGFALNVNPLMEHFSYIVPCGICNYAVASLQDVSKQVIPMEVVKRALAIGFSEEVEPLLIATELIGGKEAVRQASVVKKASKKLTGNMAIV